MKREDARKSLKKALKIRIEKLGYHNSPIARKNQSIGVKKSYENGRVPSMLGKHHSLESRKRMSNSHKTPELIELHRRNRMKQTLPIKDTSIEIKIQTFLKLLKIEFFTHQYIKNIEHGYQCDIFIPIQNGIIQKTIIECDGKYWHKYPIGNDIDHIRTKELIEKGYRVIRLWEDEIRGMMITNFKNKLLESKK
jgi:very-short-patch-repair endonuclease